jgi:hypothetical protein
MRAATHADRIHHWLDLVGARDNLPLAELREKYSDVLVELSHRTGRLAPVELSRGATCSAGCRSR